MADKNTLKDLEIGKTKIGQAQIKFEGEIKNVDVYYGNIAFAKSSDGTNKRVKLPEETYENVLKTFLTGAGGKIYKIPDPDDVNKIKEILNEKVNEGINGLHFDIVEKSVAESSKQIEGLRSQTSALNSSLDEIKEMLNEMNEEEEDGEDEDYEDEAPKTPLLVIIGLAVAVILSGASAALGVLNLITAPSATVTDTETNDEKAENVLIINGEEYTIEESEISLEDGQSSMAVYGIITTNKDGKAVKKVVSLGDADITNGTTSTTTKTETTPEATETPAE